MRAPRPRRAIALCLLAIMSIQAVLSACSYDDPGPSTSERSARPKATESGKNRFPALANPGDPCSNELLGSDSDFDGTQDHRPDIPIGIPGEDTAAGRDAGAVEVHYGCGWQPQRLEAPDGRPGDRFGEDFVVLRMPRSTHDALIVGAPGRDVDGVRDAGALYFFKGTKKGLVHWKTLTMAGRQVPGEVQAGAEFGSVLDRATARHPVLAGIPSYDVKTPTGPAEDAGAVLMFTVWGVNALYTQDSRGVPGHTEAGDRFGAAVAGTDWTYKKRYAFDAGAPGEDEGAVRDAGAVFTCAGPMPREQTCERISQNSPGIPGSSQAGDHFGASLAVKSPTLGGSSPLYIGTPGEDIGPTVDAGRVTVRFKDHPTRILDQDAPKMSGHAEAGDGFGSALTVYEDIAGQQQLLIGVPGEDLDNIRDSGFVDRLQVNPKEGTVEPQSGLHPALVGSAVPGNRFGAALGTHTENDTDYIEGWSPRFVIGVPGVDDGAGKVLVVDPESEEKASVYEQASDPAEAGDGFGSALNAID